MGETPLSILLNLIITNPLSTFWPVNQNPLSSFNKLGQKPTRLLNFKALWLSCTWERKLEVNEIKTHLRRVRKVLCFSLWQREFVCFVGGSSLQLLFSVINLSVTFGSGGLTMIWGRFGWDMSLISRVNVPVSSFEWISLGSNEKDSFFRICRFVWLTFLDGTIEWDDRDGLSLALCVSKSLEPYINSSGRLMQLLEPNCWSREFSSWIRARKAPVTASTWWPSIPSSCEDVRPRFLAEPLGFLSELSFSSVSTFSVWIINELLQETKRERHICN